MFEHELMPKPSIQRLKTMCPVQEQRESMGTSNTYKCLLWTHALLAQPQHILMPSLRQQCKCLSTTQAPHCHSFSRDKIGNTADDSHLQ